jgi:hypothetical protein
MKITTQKTGGIWHGYLEGHLEVHERALTEEMARRKVERRTEKARGEEGDHLQPDMSRFDSRENKA